MPEPLPAANRIHSRVLQHADRLFEPLEDLEASGGLAVLATRIRSAAVERTIRLLMLARAAIGAQLEGLKVGRKS